MAWSIGANVATGDVLTATRYNQDVIANMTAIGGAWTSYTPTWTNLTVGNGTNASAYVQAGKLIIVRIKFTLGSTSSVGTIPYATVPASFNSAYTGTFPVGSCTMFDLSTDAVWFGHAIPDSSLTNIRFFVDNVAGTYSTAGVVSATAPMTWATGDRLETTFVYESA